MDGRQLCNRMLSMGVMDDTESTDPDPGLRAKLLPQKSHSPTMGECEANNGTFEYNHLRMHSNDTENDMDNGNSTNDNDINHILILDGDTANETVVTQENCHNNENTVTTKDDGDSTHRGDDGKMSTDEEKTTMIASINIHSCNENRNESKCVDSDSEIKENMNNEKKNENNQNNKNNKNNKNSNGSSRFEKITNSFAGLALSVRTNVKIEKRKNDIENQERLDKIKMREKAAQVEKKDLEKIKWKNMKVKRGLRKGS